MKDEIENSVIYDETRLFEREIKPLLDEVVLKASVNRIPMMYSFAVANKDGKTEYINEMISENDAERSLYNNHIARHANVFNGFSTVPQDVDYVFDSTYDDDVMDGGDDGEDDDIIDEEE